MRKNKIHPEEGKKGQTSDTEKDKQKRQKTVKINLNKSAIIININRLVATI